jgi:hypothetical protein
MVVFCKSETEYYDLIVPIFYLYNVVKYTSNIT